VLDRPAVGFMAVGHATLTIPTPKVFSPSGSVSVTLPSSIEVLPSGGCVRIAVATDDGFVISLPYGPHADWLKNTLASGSATIVNEGHTYRVDQPEIIPMEAAAAHSPPKDQRQHRLFAVDQCLRVRRGQSD